MKDLVDPGNQVRRRSTVVIVLSTEVLAQELLLRVDTGDENGNYERRQQDSHAGPESKRPSQHIHYQTQIAWVPNSAVDTVVRVCALPGWPPAR